MNDHPPGSLTGKSIFDHDDLRPILWDSVYRIEAHCIMMDVLGLVRYPYNKCGMCMLNEAHPQDQAGRWAGIGERGCARLSGHCRPPSSFSVIPCDLGPDFMMQFWWAVSFIC